LLVDRSDTSGDQPEQERVHSVVGYRVSQAGEAQLDIAEVIRGKELRPDVPGADELEPLAGERPAVYRKMAGEHQDGKERREMPADEADAGGINQAMAQAEKDAGPAFFALSDAHLFRLQAPIGDKMPEHHADK